MMSIYLEGPKYCGVFSRRFESDLQFIKKLVGDKSNYFMNIP
jgi:hypothetical protein